jgi:3-deoxy-7-phosphoheptulonate synthase
MSAVAMPDAVFATSGSTGPPTRWLRPWDSLEDEARLVGDLIGEIDRIIAFAPVDGFLYGQLFGLVLARLRGIPVQRVASDPLAIPKLDGPGRTLLVCLSGTWSLLERLVGRLEALTDVVALHSGGPPTPATRRVLAALEPRGMRAIELFGATETGAVAHRQLSAGGPAPPWRLLPDVALLAPHGAGAEGQLEVAGPRLARRADDAQAPASWRLPDVVRMTGARRFELLGRATRLVKVNGRRCDLDRLELAVADRLPELDVACIPRPDAHRGESYEMLCARRDRRPFAADDEHHVRTVFAGVFGTTVPAPRRVTGVRAIPRTSAGKVRVPVLSDVTTGDRRRVTRTATPPPSPAPPSMWPWECLPARQQPAWQAHERYGEVRRKLLSAPPLVSFADVDELAAALAEVAEGRARLLQAGDCAERLDECTPRHIAEKVGVLEGLAGHLERHGRLPVLRVGRIAGQFAKPRSCAVELCGDRELPVFRGHMINAEEPDEAARASDPARMLAAYRASASALHVLDGIRARREAGIRGPWASHEALVLDYETPLVRRPAPGARPYLTSTQLPWIGERTRQNGLAHVGLMAEIANPVGCKLGPGADPDDVERLCATLDPQRRPGRLVLIPRLGGDRVWRELPELARRIRRCGHRVVWLCDPLHGNTRLAANGHKTRSMRDVLHEVRAFRAVLAACGEHPGGLHLETSTTEVHECVEGCPEHSHPARAPLCDPRLSPSQALRVLDAWLGCDTPPDAKGT